MSSYKKHRKRRCLARNYRREGGLPDKRGNKYDRERRRRWLIKTYGDGRTCPCTHCGCKLTKKSITVDRKIPGFQGGSYRHENIVPSCGMCNIERYHKEGKTSVGYRQNPRRRIRFKWRVIRRNRSMYGRCQRRRAA